jgi:hypothetical protein
MLQSEHIRALPGGQGYEWPEVHRGMILSLCITKNVRTMNGNTNRYNGSLLPQGLPDLQICRI